MIHNGSQHKYISINCSKADESNVELELGPVVSFWQAAVSLPACCRVLPQDSLDQKSLMGEHPGDWTQFTITIDTNAGHTLCLALSD
eukprot:5322803-Amphidinium_carterae.2